MTHSQRSLSKALVAAAITAAIASGGFTDRAGAAKSAGPFNCELGSTALPDDRWSSCALLVIDYCDLGETLLPDDRWAHCGSK